MIPLPLLQLAFLQLLVAVLEAAGALGKVRVSSYVRNPLLNTEVGGVANSLHQIGLAIDLVPDDPALYAPLAAAWRSLGLDAVFEQDHLHVELDGRMFPKEAYLPLIAGQSPIA